MVSKLKWAAVLLLLGFWYGAAPAAPIIVISTIIGEPVFWVWPLFAICFAAALAISQPWKETQN